MESTSLKMGSLPNLPVSRVVDPSGDIGAVGAAVGDENMARRCRGGRLLRIHRRRWDIFGWQIDWSLDWAVGRGLQRAGGRRLELITIDPFEGKIEQGREYAND